MSLVDRRVQLLVASFLVSSCGDKQDPVPDPADSECANEAVSYNDQVKTILDGHCTACHSSSATSRNGAPAGVDFDTYAAAEASADAANARIQAGTMPPRGPLSAADQCVFQAWIDQGKTED